MDKIVLDDCLDTTSLTRIIPLPKGTIRKMRCILKNCRQ